MAELKNYKQIFSLLIQCFLLGKSSWFMDNLSKKNLRTISFECAPGSTDQCDYKRASYDGFVACWDAKYTYWEYDRISMIQHLSLQYWSLRLFLVIRLVMRLYPVRWQKYFLISCLIKRINQQKAKEAAESRFQAGIHFGTDNDIALDLGRKVADKVIQRVKNDGADINK
jgi:hypothetical protein